MGPRQNFSGTSNNWVDSGTVESSNFFSTTGATDSKYGIYVSYANNQFTITGNSFETGISPQTKDIEVGALGGGNAFQLNMNNDTGFLPAETIQKSESGADSNVLTFTPPDYATTYTACISITTASVNSATIGWTTTWTDMNGINQAPTNLLLNSVGSSTPELTFSAQQNHDYYGCQELDVSNSGSPIVIQTTFTGTSITYWVSAWITQG